MYLGLIIDSVFKRCPSFTVCVCTHLYAFSSSGPQSSPDDLLHHIWQQTSCYQKDYAQPGWTTGQHLHEYIVHPLIIQEGPESRRDENSGLNFWVSGIYIQIMITVIAGICTLSYIINTVNKTFGFLVAKKTLS